MVISQKIKTHPKIRFLLMSKVTIAIPVFNNGKNLQLTYQRLRSEVLQKLDDYEVIFVDDGSSDNSYTEMQLLQQRDQRVKLIKLSRNFGQHQAILAGLENSNGDCVTVISADLQDPPVLIYEMYKKWQEGNKVVIAVRETRSDNLSQKIFSSIYHRLIRQYALKEMPIGGFDCFLADRQVIQILVQIDEKNTSLFAQILWLGFKRAQINYKRESRKIGKSGWTFSKKIKLFLDSFLAFSYLPIRLISCIGIIDCLLSFMFIIYLVIHKIIAGTGGVIGWSSLMVAIMFSSGVQMLTLGVIGEYLWRNFDATRKRPNFIVETKDGFDKF